MRIWRKQNGKGKFFINKEGKVVAHFEHPSETIRVELLSNEREDLFAVTYGDANGYNIVKILDDGTHKILANYDEIEFGEEEGTFAVQKMGFGALLILREMKLLNHNTRNIELFTMVLLS